MKVQLFLGGGLGNNLFQICLGHYLEQKGHDVVYKTALTRKNLFTGLMKWSIHSDAITSQLLDGQKLSSKLTLSDVFFLLKSYLTVRLFNKDLHFYNESKLAPKMWGYYQIGDHLNSQNLESFRRFFFEKVTLEEVENEKFCSIHIRRGDFPVPSRLAYDYYLEALKSIPQDTKVYLMSDSKQEFEAFSHVAGRVFLKPKVSSLVGDFSTILRSDIAIMSNSTFCFWAVTLGKPQQSYFPDRISFDRSWYYPVSDLPFAKAYQCTFDSEK